VKHYTSCFEHTLPVALLGRAINAFGYDWTFIATGVALLLLGMRFASRLR
jgi:hypothetical protein